MSKITITILTLGFLCICGLFTAWRVTTSDLKIARNNLEIVQKEVNILKADKNKLVNYLQQREDQIKVLETKYQQALNTIPADVCGDTKPSKELLEYFKSL